MEGKMAKPHEVHKARLMLEESLRAIFESRREVYAPWGECTPEAEPFRRLDVESLERLREAAAELRHLAWQAPAERKKGLWPAFRRLERAWSDTHVALNEWLWAPRLLRRGDAALEEIRKALNTLYY